MPIDQLHHYIRVYDDSLDAPLCRRLIDSFHTLARFHQSNGRTVRKGLEESAWTELNVSRMSDPMFLGAFKNRIDAAVDRYNADVGLRIPVPHSPDIADLILKRYRQNSDEQFQLHFDSVGHVCNRYLVVLWYLNDVEHGGETRFPQLDVAVAPKAGRLLMFPPYWMYQHEGITPISADKYIVSTYLLFRNN